MYASLIINFTIFQYDIADRSIAGILIKASWSRKTTSRRYLPHTIGNNRNNGNRSQHARAHVFRIEIRIVARIARSDSPFSRSRRRRRQWRRRAYQPRASDGRGIRDVRHIGIRAASLFIVTPSRRGSTPRPSSSHTSGSFTVASESISRVCLERVPRCSG